MDPDRSRDHGDVRHAGATAALRATSECTALHHGGLNTGIVLAVIGAIVGEFVGAKTGIGVLIRKLIPPRPRFDVRGAGADCGHRRGAELILRLVETGSASERQGDQIDALRDGARSSMLLSRLTSKTLSL